MPSDITSSDFTNQSSALSICDQLQEKLLNNNKMRTLLDYFFSDPSGEFAQAFIADIVAFLGPVGKVVLCARAITNPAIADGTGPVWLECNGDAHLKSDYPNLSGHLGATFNTATDNDNTGFDANTHFRVPDFRGRFPVGIKNAVYDEAARAGSATASIPVHEHIHVFGQYENSSTDTDNNLFLENDKDAPITHPAPTNYSKLRDAGGLGGAAAGNLAGPVAMTKLPCSLTGDAVDDIVADTIPPYHSCRFYILAGFRLRGTLL